MRFTRFFPIIGGSPVDRVRAALHGMSWQAYKLADLIIKDDRQGRRVFSIDKTLATVAQNKATDMQNRNYFSHNTPDRISPNQMVRAAGIELPDWYKPVGNNVESIAGNQQTAAEVVEAFWQSDGHREHVFGLDPFWARHNIIGTGYAENRTPGQLHSTVWVVLTAQFVAS